MPPPTHNMLTRQLKRYLGSADAMPSEWRPLIQAVNDAYHEFDKDRGLLERSLELSSEELIYVNASLRESEEHIRKTLDAILSPEGDIGTLELADIIDTQAIQLIMNDFFQLTHIGVAILDIHGKILVATGWQDICTKFHRVHPKTCKYCIESDTMLSEGVAPGTFKIYRCKNNMWDIVTPIMVGGKHLGNLFLGQFLFEGDPPDYELFRAQARQYGFNEQEYLAALERVPRWSRETVNAVMNFYTKFAHMFSMLSYGRVKLARALTERNELLLSLRATEERFRQVADSIGEWIWEVDVNGLYTYSSSAAERILGFTPEELVGKKHFYDLFAPDVREELKKAASEIIARKQPFRNLVNPNVHKDGRVIILETSGMPVLDPEGRLLGYRGADMDITERKRAEGEIRNLLEQSDKDRDALLGILEDVKRGQDALRRSEEALRQANQMLRLHFEQTPMAVIEWDLDFRVTQWNPAARTIFGFSREEAVGQHASFILPEAVRPQVDQVWQALLKRSGGARSTNQNMRKDGRAILCEWYNTPLVDERGKVAGVASLVQDITERERAEQALRKSEASMADAQARAHVGSWELDLTTQEATWSHEMYRLFGRDPSRGVPTFEEFLDLVHTEDRPALIEARRRALETGELVHTDFRTNPEQAPARYIQGRLQGVRDPSGRITGLVGTEADLTERKQAEETMRRQLEELRRWQAVILGREDRVLELKKEVNELARKLGEKPRYEGGIKAE